MALKRYNQFINENDEFELNDEFENTEMEMDVDDMDSDDLDDMDVEDLDLIEDDGTNDLIDDDVEEEEDVDIYTTKLKELADRLDAELEDGKLVYNGKTIIFPSETEMYHVDKRKFKTADEVVNYLTKHRNGPIAHD